MNLERYQNWINEHLANIQEQLDHRLLGQILAYALKSGGKRLRPVICFLAYRLFDQNEKNVIQQALALELFHNFTLVHDDIMDEAPLRRGKESVHKRFGRDNAILSGDVIMILAYDYLVQNTPAHLVKPVLACFSQMAVQVCEGQMMDMDLEVNRNPAMADYLKMIELKTSVLLGAAFKIGGLCAGADERTAEKLYKYGVYNGIAFQIQDDLLDAYGDSAAVGKQKGGDIIRAKKTALSILCHEQATADGIHFMELLESNDLPAEEKVERVLGLYDEYGIRDRITELKKEYTSKGHMLLDQIEGDPGIKAEIRKLAALLSERSY